MKIKIKRFFLACEGRKSQKKSKIIFISNSRTGMFSCFFRAFFSFTSFISLCHAFVCLKMCSAQRPSLGLCWNIYNDFVFVAISFFFFMRSALSNKIAKQILEFLQEVKIASRENKNQINWSFIISCNLQWWHSDIVK